MTEGASALRLISSANVVVLAVVLVLATICGISRAAPVEGSSIQDEIMTFVPPAIRDAFTGTGFATATIQSLVMILVTEMGDKTFFIAAIMAMKQSRVQVLIGALGALYLMTILSAALGKAFPLLMDKKYTSSAAAVLFAYFGVQLLRDWWKSRDSDGENEELHEVEESLMGTENGSAPQNSDANKVHKSPTPSNKPEARPPLRSRIPFLSPTAIRAFTLTFLAEWGDRSQIATIALAAAKDVYGVTFGGVLGHTVCTTIAVLGGRMLAARISERAVSLIGGLLFLSFAGLTASGHFE